MLKIARSEKIFAERDNLENSLDLKPSKERENRLMISQDEYFVCVAWECLSFPKDKGKLISVYRAWSIDCISEHFLINAKLNRSGMIHYGRSLIVTDSSHMHYE